MSSLTRALRMFSEVTITAERIGVDDSFWHFLTDSRLTFEIIAGLPSHFAIMQKRKISFIDPIEDKTEALREWIYSLDPDADNLLDIKPSWEIFDFSKELLLSPEWVKEDIDYAVHEAFQRELFIQIFEMGISVQELTTLPHSTLVEENRKIIFRPNSLEITIDNLIRDIKIVICQRKFIRDMLEIIN